MAVETVGKYLPNVLSTSTHTHILATFIVDLGLKLITILVLARQTLSRTYIYYCIVKQAGAARIDFEPQFKFW